LIMMLQRKKGSQQRQHEDLQRVQASY
jgi:hypothetical protein